MTVDHEWHDWRARGIGASDIAAILGLSNYASPYTVWCSKVGLLEPSESTQRQRIGHRMESVLAAEFHEDTGLYVAGEQTWCAHRDMPWARATVDGFVVEANHDGEVDGEAVYPDQINDQLEPDRSMVLGTWQAKTDGRFGWPDGVPANIRAQCIWELGVTDLEHCWLTVMFAGFRIEHFEIEWDADAKADWALMVERASAFWHDHVLTGEPPAVDGSDATAEALARIYPDHHVGESVSLDDIAERLSERLELKAAIKRDKARLDEIDNDIKARMREAEVGTVDDVPALTLRSQTRAEHVVAESTFRVLRSAPKQKART